MKKIFTLLFLLLSFIGFSQKVVDRANGASTVADSRLMAKLNFYAPRYSDTSSANVGSSVGIDSCGALIYTYNTDSYWYRACFPVKHWVQVGSGSSGGTNIYNADGTLTADRVLSGSMTHVLTFDSLAGFGTFSYTDNINYTQIQQDPSSVSLRNIHNGVDNFVSVTAGIVQLSAEDSISLTYPGAAPSVATLGSFKLQARSPTGGLVDYTGAVGALFGVSDTLFSANRYTNAANYTFKHKGGVDNFGGVDSCGARLSYAWSTNPLSASVWTSSGTAPTTSGSNTTINGTNTLTSLIHTGVENWSMTGTFITNVKSTSTQNISISLNSDTLSGITSRRFVFVMHQDSGYINYYNNDALTIPNYSSKATTVLAWAAADTFDYKIVYHRGVVNSYIKNRANGQKSVLNFIYTNTANVAQIKINTVGNFTYPGSFIYTIDEPFRPKFLLMDNSTGIGSGASSTYYRWWDDLFANYSDLHVMHSGAGERSSQGVLRIDEVVNAIQPQYIIWGYGVNDLAGGSIALYSQNTSRVSDSANAHGIGLIYQYLVPQVANVQTYNDTDLAISTRKGGRVINITTTLQQGNGGGFNKNVLYQPTSDLVHLNDLGQSVQADLVAKGISDLLTCVPTLVNSKYPLYSGNYKFLAGFNSANQLVAIPDGLSNNYVQNLAPVIANVQQTAQTASMNISGDQYIGGSVYWPGNGNFANPAFKFTASTGTTDTRGGALIVGQFTGGNFSIISNNPQLAGGTFQLSGSPVFLSSSPVAFTANNPSGNGITEEFTIDNNTNILANTSHIMRWRNFGTTKGFIDAGGGVHTDSVSGYNFNNSSLYGPQSWVSKKYADSLLALALTNPMTTAGDIIYGGSSGTPTRLAAGTSTYVLTSNGAGVAPSWQPVSAGSGIALSALTAAAATNDIDNLNFRQRWRWTTLAGDTAHVINVTSTAAASNAQVGFAVMMKGANGTTTQTTTGGYFENTHSGTLSNNIALQAVASGGATTNFAIYTGTAAANNGAMFINGAITTAASFGNISTGASTSVTIAAGNGAVNCSSVSNVGLVNGNISIIPLQAVVMSPGNAETFRFNTAANNQSFTNTAGVGTAAIHLKAGTATASTAPLKFTAGTNLTAAEAGAVEWNGTNLFITQTTGPTRKTIAYTTDVPTASTGITNTAGTWTVDLSTGIAGGQTVRGGTAANDQLLLRGTIVASGSTLTNPNMTFIAGDGAGLTAAQILNNGTVSARYLTGTTAVGSIAAGAGAGTTPTVSISGTDLGGFISITTGTVPTLSATVATITFGNAYPAAPKSIIITPANSNAALLSGVTSVFVDQAGISTTTFAITAGTTALTGSTAYKFYYQVIQ